MPIDPSLLGPATLAISQAVSSFTTFLPPLAEIRKNHPDIDPSFAADVRVGELAAIGITLGIGAMVSTLTGSSVPVIVGLATAVGLVVLYESVLKSDRPMEVK